jgi:DNA-binding transcriptional LysR family regulator
MDRLLSMRTFARVVDEGSFAGAARKLSLNQAVVTRLVADLESHLGTRLLHRTTRSLSLTDAGEHYLVRCRQILADVEAAEEEVGDGDGRIGGKVRVAVPAYLALEVMAKRGPKFHALYPDIVLDVALLDRPVDLVAEGFDVAVLPSSISVPSTLITRSLGEKAIVLAASAAYVRAHGAPERPEDLAKHPCIGYNAYSQREQWRLTRAGGETALVTVNYIMQTNSLAFVHRALRNGLAIGPLVRYETVAEPESDPLVPVLPGWTLGSFELHIVYPSREYLPRRVRAVIDFFIEERAALEAKGSAC